VTGIPHAVLVDPSGKVVWRGYPSTLEPSELDATLEGALTVPLWEWPDSAKGVRALVQKGQLGKALGAAKGLGAAEPGPAIVASIEGMVRSKVEGIESARKAGDFLAVQTRAEAAIKSLEGLPELEVAKQALDEIKADKEAQLIIKGQSALEEIRAKAAEAKKAKDVDGLMAKVRKIAKEYPGTIVEKQAIALERELMMKSK
jgi:hypothetical protein